MRTSRLILAVLIMSLAFVDRAIPQNTQTAQSLMAEGQRLLGESKCIEALKTFEKMLSASPNDEWKAAAMFNIARTYAELGEYPKADKYLSTAETFYTQNRKEAEIATVWQLKARILTAQNDYSRAGEYYLKAESILRRLNKKELILVLFNKADMFTAMCRFDDARKTLREAGEVCASINENCSTEMDQFEGNISAKQQLDDARQKLESAYHKTSNQRRRAVILNVLGMVDQNYSRFDEAEHRFISARDIARKLNDPLTESYCLQNLGNLYLQRGQYSEAYSNYSRALELAKRQGNRLLEANISNSLGGYYQEVADYSKAYRCLQTALQIGDEIGVPDIRGWAYHNAGLLLKDLGDFGGSEYNSRQALRIAGQVGAPRLEAMAMIRLGNLYEYVGDYDNALTQYLTGLKKQERIGDLFFQSNTRMDLANIYLRRSSDEEDSMKDISAAKENFEKALQLKERMKVPMVEARCKFALFHLEKPKYHKDERPDLDAAREQIRRAENSIGKNSDNDRMLLNYTIARFKLEEFMENKSPGKLDECIRESNKLAELAKKAGSKKYAFLADICLGLANEELKQYQHAADAFQRARSYAEQIRDGLDDQQRKTFLHGEEILGMKHVVPYEGLSRVLLKLGRNVEALNCSDETKARAFSDKLECAQLGDQVCRSKREIQDKLRSKETQRDKLITTATHREKSIIEDEIQKLQNRFESLKGDIKRNYPGLFAVMFPFSTGYGLKTDLQPYRIEKNDWILAYDVTDTELLIYVINGRREVGAFAKPISRSRLDSLVKNYVEHIRAKRIDGRDVIFKFQPEKSRELTRILLEDALSLIPRGSRLIIMPDDCIGLLPFDALVLDSEKYKSDEPTYFFAQYCSDIVHSQSLNALTYSRSMVEKSNKSGKIFVVADPCKDPGKCGKMAPGNRADLAKSKSMEASLAQVFLMEDRDCESKLPEMKRGLPLAGELPKKLRTIYGSDKVTSLTGPEATLDATLKVFNDNFRYLIFAVHGSAGSDVVGPKLYLADGCLNQAQIAGRRINSDLVALTACESALGKEITGEGVMGMGRAFQYAGAKNVMMSLWSVDEGPSVRITEIMFQEINKGEKIHAAFNTARKAIMTDEELRHPFNWAGFILTGVPD